MPHEANEALHNLSDRHKMSQTARGMHTDTHIHTLCADVVSCKSCLLVRSVFSDEQVAAEDRASAREQSLDILTNPF